MVLWCIIVGLLAGWVMDLLYGGGGVGALIGLVLGWPAGLALRAAVRQEIRAALANFEGAAPHHEPQQPAVSISSGMETTWTPPEQPADEEPPAEEAIPADEAEPEVSSQPEPVAAPEPAVHRAAAFEQSDRAAYEHEPATPVESKLRQWLLGGNTIVRVGLLILFVGLSFLVRFAVEAGWFPIQLRLALVGASGAVLVAVGFNRRTVRPSFGLALQGAGVAVLYLTVFAAARVYDLLPPLPAFALMVVFSALGCALALLQDSQRMAFGAFAGGFAVPLLLGGHTETPLPLFTYGTVLNLAILMIAWRRSWRSLNLLGFFATYGIAALWAAGNYTSKDFMICEVFLAISLAISLMTAVLYAHNTPGRFGNVADSTLLFGPALVGFGLQVGLVEPYRYGSALSALGFAAIYVGFALVCLRKQRHEMRVMIESMGAIALGFVTLAVPLALDARWTSCAWALEGAGAFWVGLRQARWMQRLFGLLLQAVAVVLFLVTLQENVAAVPLFNRQTVGGLIVALPVLATAWWLRRPLLHSGTEVARTYGEAEHSLRFASFLVGFALLCLTMVLEVCRAVPSMVAGTPPEPVLSLDLQRLTAMVMLLAMMALSAWLGRRLDWNVARWPSRISLFVAGIGLLAQISAGRNVLYWPDIAFFVAVLALHLHMIHAEDRALDRQEGHVWRGWQALMHAGTVWLAVAMAANAIYLGIERGNLWNTSWSGVIVLDSVVAALFVLTLWAGRSTAGTGRAERWPLNHYASSYYWIAAVPLAVMTAAGALATALLAEGVTDPLPYIPVINPVDLSLGLAFAALLAWRRMLAAVKPRPPEGSEIVTGGHAVYLGAGLAFVFVNMIWLRTAHHWLNVDWNGSAIFGSFEVQTGLAIIWTLIAMTLMITAHRRQMRRVWIPGAMLLGLVVIKLLTVDMSNSDGWERVVAFIAVGVLMLVIGYFAPLPPSGRGGAAEEKA